MQRCPECSVTLFFLLLGFFRSTYYAPWTRNRHDFTSRKWGHSMYSTCMCGVFLAKHTQRRSALSVWLTRLSHFSWLQPLGQWYLAGESKSCVSHVSKERGGICQIPRKEYALHRTLDRLFLCIKEVASRFLKLFIFPPKQSCFGSIVYVLLIFKEGD